MGKRIGKVLCLALAPCAVWLGCSDAVSPNPVTDPSVMQPPPAGQGFQFKTDAFPVPAGTEEQDCYFFKVRDLAMAAGLPGDQPVELHRIQIRQKDGSHHMNIFRVRTIVGLDPANGAIQRGKNGMGECFKSANWADWPLVANTQQKVEIDWTYPDGVANELAPDETLMLQTHFVNATSQQSPDGVGQVAVNFWTIPKEKVTAQLGTLFATNQSIRICQSNPTPTYTTSCQIKSPNPVTIIGANGHFHSRGTVFDMYSWDGTTTGVPPQSQRFYESTVWNDPPMLHSPDLDTSVVANGGVVYSCSYRWSPPAPSIGCDGLNAFDQMKHGTTPDKFDCCYTFGPIVDKNEHCNAFIYYYPKQDDVTCF